LSFFMGETRFCCHERSPVEWVSLKFIGNCLEMIALDIKLL
jgi:hypothetical protein